MTGRVQELLAFALDLYRAPLKYLPFVAPDRPIPAGLDALLETLNKRPDSEVWKAMGWRLKTSPDELRDAGLFLVKRLLFTDSADHYRILGVGPNADIAQIRERYRLLMALFHPDRLHQRDEWIEQYAPRINEAYNALKNPDKKQAYDRTLEVQEDPWGDDLPSPDGGIRTQSEQRHRRNFKGFDAVQTVEGGFWGRPKSRRVFVVIGVVLLAAVGGLSVLLRGGNGPNATVEETADAGFAKSADVSGILYLAHSDKSAQRPESTAPGSAAISMNTGSGDTKRGEQPPPAGTGFLAAALPNEANPQDPVEAVDTGGDTVPALNSLEPMTAGIPQASVTRQERAPQASPKPPQVAGGNSKQSATLPRIDPGASPDGSSKDATDLTGVNVSSKPVKATGSVHRRGFIDQRDIDFLISRFIQAYEAGDTEKFTRLFSYRVKTNDAVGRDAIATQYGKLFRESENRSLVIKDLKWALKGDSAARISFFAAIAVESIGSSVKSDYEGGVDLHVRRDNQRLTIVEFLHQVGKK